MCQHHGTIFSLKKQIDLSESILVGGGDFHNSQHGLVICASPERKSYQEKNVVLRPSRIIAYFFPDYICIHLNLEKSKQSDPSIIMYCVRASGRTP
jgi:hypothetical protein